MRVSETKRRVLGLLSRIGEAAERSTHTTRPVTVVAVTKHHPAAAVDAVAEAGLVDMGENRVQEALEKSPDVRAAVRWHLIGHLQRNKVNKALTLFGTIHSVDSVRLIEALGSTSTPLDIFLQINVSGEQSKFGASPEQAADLLRAAAHWPSLDVLGLMTMAPYADDPEQARPCFRALRELRGELNAAGIAPPMDGLSMGMSGDFEVAIEEGATHVRIGGLILPKKPPLSG